MWYRFTRRPLHSITPAALIYISANTTVRSHLIQYGYSGMNVSKATS
jgi:hypothetical protein